MAQPQKLGSDPVFSIFRLYGPLEAWFDQTWRPGEIELVKYAQSMAPCSCDDK